MTFPEYYKQHYRGQAFQFPAHLPDDVRKDLRRMIANNDKRLGVYVIHACGTPSDDGLTFAYYMRSWHPHFIYTTILEHDIPCGLRFWRMKKINR